MKVRWNRRAVLAEPRVLRTLPRTKWRPCAARKRSDRWFTGLGAGPPAELTNPIATPAAKPQTTALAPTAMDRRGTRCQMSECDRVLVRATVTRGRLPSDSWPVASASRPRDEMAHSPQSFRITRP